MLLMKSSIMSAVQTIHLQTLYITLQTGSHIEVSEKIFLNSKFINSDNKLISSCRGFYNHFLTSFYAAVLQMKILILLVEKTVN